MLKRSVFGVLFGLAIIILTIYFCGGYPIVVFDLASIIIMIALPFAASFISHGPSATGRAIRTALSGKAADIIELKRAKACMKALTRYVVTASALSFFIGLIYILKNLDNPDRIGPNLAVALISVLYGAILALLFTQPLTALLDDRILAMGGEA